MKFAQRLVSHANADFSEVNAIHVNPSGAARCPNTVLPIKPLFATKQNRRKLSANHCFGIGAVAVIGPHFYAWKRRQRHATETKPMIPKSVKAAFPERVFDEIKDQNLLVIRQFRDTATS